MLFVMSACDFVCQKRYAFLLGPPPSDWEVCVARFLTILKSCLVASFPDEVGPVPVSEIASSITSEFESELRTYEFPMNCSICGF